MSRRTLIGNHGFFNSPFVAEIDLDHIYAQFGQALGLFFRPNRGTNFGCLDRATCVQNEVRKNRASADIILA
jgi:hypothetical protein